MMKELGIIFLHFSEMRLTDRVDSRMTGGDKSASEIAVEQRVAIIAPSSRREPSVTV